jgi:hypothetical protein
MAKGTAITIKHADIYFAGLILVAVALPCSTFLMSIGQMVLALNWLWERKYQKKLRSFFHNKIAVIVISLFLLHVIGLIWTSDFNYAFKDLRVKSPLFILPFIMATTAPLNKKRFDMVLLFFVASILFCSLVSIYVLITRQIIDIRSISIFISHIRFSLLICLSIFILAYFVFRKNNYPSWAKGLFAIVCGWLIAFLFVLESATGLTILTVTSLIILLYLIFTQKKVIVKIFAGLIILGIISGAFFFLRSIIKEFYYKAPIDIAKLDKYTSRGKAYINLVDDNHFENGNRLYIYFCPEELETAWNQRSKYCYSGKDQNGQDIKYTLLRFLTSKGYRKDADGVNKLTDEEVHAIEQGNANYKYSGSFSIRYRIYQTIWEYETYRESGNPNNLSMMQRLEFWKASIGIIKENWLIGVGTGDLPVAFKEQYITMKTLLDPKQRWRSHNQYLSIMVAFGFLGFLWFMIFLFYPGFKSGKLRTYFYFAFFVIALLSMLTEDTIETQAGVTFFAFFNSFFLFAEENNSGIINSKENDQQ